MQTFSYLLQALIRATLLTCAGFVAGWVVGHGIAGIFTALLAALVWHIYSGLWLSEKLKTSSSLTHSFLPLTFEDARISDASILQSKALLKSEKQNERLQKTLRASAEALPAGIIVINKDNRVQWANSKAAIFVGVRDPQDIGQHVDNLLRHPQFTEMLKRKSKSLDKLDDIQITSPLNDRVHLRISLNRYAKSLRLITIEDISAFQRINKMRQNFIGNASHELRTPLTVIRGYLDEFLDDKTLPSEWQVPLGEIDKQVTRTQDILEDMLTLSHLESRPRLAVKRAVNFSELINQVVIDLRQASGNSHNINSQCPEQLKILGDESELYSVISNLIKNALLYSPKNTEIEVSWQQTDLDGQLAISDQGVGVPEESLIRLTERFYRVDNARSSEMGGTGLGLAIVKHALMRHESSLSIESKEGEGSRFICHFPVHRIVA